MSTPETPPQPSIPVASDAHVSAPDVQGASAHAVQVQPAAPHSSSAGSSQAEPGAPEQGEATHAGGGGDGEHGSDAPTESDDGGEASENGHAAGASAHAPSDGEAPAGEKKRRRRRRKKRGGGVATSAEGGAPVGSEAVGQDAPEGGDVAEGDEGEESDGVSAEGGPSDDKAELRAKKRAKRPGPARERPPVNAGDIVFGKILDITEEAIIVDIPGKAHAIFDRREMLLPEDDEPARAARAAAKSENEAKAAAAAAQGEAEVGETASVASPAPAEVTAEGTAGLSGVPTPAPSAEAASNPTDGPVVAESGAAPRESVSAPSSGHERPPELPEGGGLEAASAEAPAPREPKVPRVILEVGADFIGVVHNDGARGGLVVLTHHPSRGERAKPAIEKAFNDKALIEGLVTGVIKGGIEVDVDGVRAFAPGSHVDLRLGADLTHLLAKRLTFIVTQYAKRGRDVVLSRKAMLEDESRKARTEALAKLRVGDEVDGVVRSVVPFGAFVDIGGIEGLVPLKEMSHNRAEGPSDVFKAGDPTRVKVVMIDDKGKVWLSRRATIPDPWQQVAKKYAPGTRHTGKVARLKDFGVFVELEAGVDGLIHTADLSIKRIEDPSEVVKVGDTLEVVVSHVDGSNHKIALHPAPQGDAASEAPQRVVPHKSVKAKVVNIESGGLVVRILGVTGRSARGYVTAAGTGTARGTELRKAFTIGQEIEGKVIEIDPRRGEVKLSIKALSEDQERNAYQQYRQQLKAEARFTFGDLLAKKGTPSR